MRLEQPMPETKATSCGGRPTAANARVMAVTTPKSPQPGHHIGLRSLLKSPAWNWAGERGSGVAVAVMDLFRISSFGFRILIGFRPRWARVDGCRWLATRWPFHAVVRAPRPAESGWSRFWPEA